MDRHVTSEFCEALPVGDTARIQDCLSQILRGALQEEDRRLPGEKRESLYQGILMARLLPRWNAQRGQESGEGVHSCISFRPSDALTVVIELRDSTKKDQIKNARKALGEIKDRESFRELVDSGCGEILEYGIACRMDSVCVRMKRHGVTA